MDSLRTKRTYQVLAVSGILLFFQAGAVDRLAAQSRSLDTVVVVNPDVVRVALGQAYPELFRRAGIAGVVGALIRIQESGQIDSLEILDSSGHAQLDKAVRSVSRLARFSVADSVRWAVWPVEFIVPREEYVLDSEGIVCPPVMAFVPALQAIANRMRSPKQGLRLVGDSVPGERQPVLVDVSPEIEDSPHCNSFLAQALSLDLWLEEEDEFGVPLICIEDLCSNLDEPRFLMSLKQAGTSWPGHEWVFRASFKGDEGGIWWVRCDGPNCSVSRRSLPLS